MKFVSLRHSLGSKMATETSAQPGDWKFTVTNPTDDNVTITGTNITTDYTTNPFNGFNATVPHNDIETVKTHVQIAPNVYLKIIDEGGRAIFHLCENLEDNEAGALKVLAGEFLPEYYKKDTPHQGWRYYNYKCNKCGVMIPDELVNKADVMGQLAKFKTNNG